MFANKKSDPYILDQARLRMVDARTKTPLTPKVEARVDLLNKRGAIMVLESAFINNYHILMGVHNTKRTLAQLSFPPENPQTQEEVSFWGEIKSLSKVGEEKMVHFRVELDWVEPNIWDGHMNKTLKRLIRMAKSVPRLKG